MSMMNDDEYLPLRDVVFNTLRKYLQESSSPENG